MWCRRIYLNLKEGKNHEARDRDAGFTVLMSVWSTQTKVRSTLIGEERHVTTTRVFQIASVEFNKSVCVCGQSHDSSMCGALNSQPRDGYKTMCGPIRVNLVSAGPLSPAHESNEQTTLDRHSRLNNNLRGFPSASRPP